VDLHDYLEVLRRRWISVAIVALTTLALSAAVTLAMTTQYTATTRLYFAVEGTETATDLAQGSSFAEKQMTSYAEVATAPLVLDPVIDRLNLETTSTDLARTVTAVIPPDTVILQISAVDPDPKRAAAIANAIGQEVDDVAGELSPERADGSKAVQATTLAPALVPTDPSSPKSLRNLALGVLLGLLFGVGTALLRNVLDTKIRSEHDVRAVTESPLLGVIGQDDKVPAHPIILRDEPLSAAAESVRRLRTNLKFTDLGDHPRSIVITSAIPGEGKSTTAVNLAVAMADAGSRVILVDADLRRPSVATCMGMEGRVGLTTVLIGRTELRDVVQHWQNSTLDVLPSGRIPPNPSELLGSAAMERLLGELTATYDVVLLDTPPLLPVTDAAVLSSLVGGSLLVIGADRVQRPQLQQAIESLETAGAHLHGVVVNKIARQESAAYVYDAGYEPLPAVEVITAAAPKRARPEPKHHRPANGWANGSTHEEPQRSREATPVPH
jgi:capsular exopolysaccharide synthesis family protein